MRVEFRPTARLDVLDAEMWYEGRVRGLGAEFALAVDAAVAALYNCGTLLGSRALRAPGLRCPQFNRKHVRQRREIVTSLDLPQSYSCSFCDYLAGRRACAFVVRGEAASAFVNPTQYERGAVLVVPNTHVTTILDATDDDVSAAARLARTVARALDLAFVPTGLNVFQNNGRAAGQSEPHYHVHVVPRYGEWEPMKLFRARDFPFQPTAELEPIAAEIRQALASLTSGAA